jgi:hypothetical protein
LGESHYSHKNTVWLPDIFSAAVNQSLRCCSNASVQTNRFGFAIVWASGMAVVVEASTNLANASWDPLATNFLSSGSSYFSDAAWTNSPQRFYRLRSL